MRQLGAPPPGPGSGRAPPAARRARAAVAVARAPPAPLRPGRQPARLADERPVLFEQLARFGACVVGLLDRQTDAVAPLVDRRLDPLERDALEDPERDGEADDGPDHQAEADLDQRIGRDEPVHQTRTYARIEPSRP